MQITAFLLKYKNTEKNNKLPELLEFNEKSNFGNDWLLFP